MRVRTSVHIFGCMLIAVSVSGCAGTATVLSSADRQSLQSLPLFASDGTPQFSVQLACRGEFASCNTIRRGFEHWTGDRHIQMQMVESLDAAPHAAHQAAIPYQLAVSIAPLVVDSYDKINVKGDDLSGHYTPPKVSYRAELEVFDAGTGKQLRHMSLHDERVADFKADAGNYLRAELKTLIADVDPAYRSR